MKLGIMQPYFLPYLGYFQLINAVDRYVIYDDANYIKQGWINRNRILLDGEPFMFSLQLSGASSFKKINEIRLGDNQEKVYRTLQHAYSRAPFYRGIIDLLYRITHYETKSLSDYVINSIHEICNYLNINTEILISSDLEKDQSLKGEEKVIYICKLLKADTYLNTIGGINLYQSQRFRQEGLHLLFLNMRKINYKQFCLNFIADLSIIDVLMFNDRTAILEMLSQYDLIEN
ncbi:MAG TPA: WbqC family protein [Bacteroidales bacterium]|nr:WbqC family protein [Bacteroidales bacterium]